MISKAFNIEEFFMFYKDNDIESLKNAYTELQNDIEWLRKVIDNYRCNCLLKTIHINVDIHEKYFVAFVDDIEHTNLCCNCHYLLIAKSNNAAGENPDDHHHPRFAEELMLITRDMVHRAILGIEYGLKDLTDDEIDTLCREYPDVGIELARDFNSYFNDLEL